MGIRAVYFDIGDTLWHAPSAPPPAEFRRLAAAGAAGCLERWGIAAADPGAIARVAWEALEEATRKARNDGWTEPDYAQATLDALRRYGLDLTHEQATELMHAIYIGGVEGGKQSYPDAAPTLRELRARGFKLGVITNRAFGGERFRTDLRDAGIDCWDAIAVSVEVGYLKPHPRIYEYALEQLHVRPEQSMMVGNSLAEDIAGAQSIGMKTAWRRSAADADNVTPDYTFDEVSELLDVPELQRPG